MAEGIDLDVAPLAVIDVDAATCVSGWNRRAAQILGVTAAEAVGRRLDELLPLVETMDGWSSVLADDGMAPRVWPIRRAAGVMRFEAWSRGRRDADGRVTGATIFGHDASARVAAERQLIRELSTPIIEVWDGVLTLPIVGLVDSARTAEIMDNLLSTVTRTRSRFAILDLTGVEVVDTGTAAHLIGMIQAVRLLGAEGILTGIHPLIAQTMVSLGVDLSHVLVFAKLRDALKHCIVQMSKRGAAR